MMNVMPQYTNVQSSTQNVSSADNQQATPWKKWESPQRLHAEYPNGKATLLGILYTDGCLSRKSKYTWRFYLGNTSLEIIMVFRACMMNIFGLDDQRIRIAQKMVNGKPYYSAIVDIFTKKGFSIDQIKISYYGSRYFSFFVPFFIISVIYEVILQSIGIKNLGSYILIVAKKDRD